MILDRVSFHSHPAIFQVEWHFCDDFECPCTQVTFKLRELGSQRRDRPSGPLLKIRFRVDVLDWQEVNPPERSPIISEIVAEFLRDYPDFERQVLKKQFEHRHRMLDRLRVAVVDPQDVREGLLLRFRDLFESPLEPGWLCPLGEYLFSAEGTLYLVSERYCLNPTCECREVIVSFAHCTPLADPSSGAVMEDHFRARISLDGDYQLDKLLKIDRSTAQELLAQWRNKCKEQLETLSWRYDKMKEVGRRSLATAPRATLRSASPIDPRLQPLRRTEERVGRNDPCPCGSGKKYKKCCARSDELPT